MITWHKASASAGNNSCVEVGWRKSSRSLDSNCVEVGAMAKSSHSAGGNCVEAGPCACGGDILVRDTKNRDGGTLAFSRAGWGQFLAAVKAGEFDG